MNIIRNLENENLKTLSMEFEGTLNYIKEIADADVPRCRSMLKELEYVLLSHEIRGSTIASEVCPMAEVVLGASRSDWVKLEKQLDDVSLTRYVFIPADDNFN